MKNAIFLLGLVISLSMFTACSVGYVSAEPVYQEPYRPVRPAANYVWIDGNWIWSSSTNNYNYSGGNWVVPYRNQSYTPGYWQKNKHGNRWKNGRWH